MDFEKTYWNNKDKMRAVAWRLLHSQELAEEAVHDVFVKAVLLWDELSLLAPRRLTAWLLLAVRYRALDILAKEERCTPMHEDVLEAFLNPSFQERPAKDILKYLTALPQKYGSVLLLYYIYGYRAREIGQLLGIATNTAEQRLSRGRRLLRQLLEDEEKEMLD